METTMPRDAGPLAGIRVVELAGLGPAPLACTLLADLGADVVRVARPGDAGHVLADGRPTAVADLKDGPTREAFLRLLESADVLIDVFRPGVLERLGLGPEVCSARNPRLVQARVTGWGQEGPRAHEAGHDINYLSLTGLLHAVGEPGRKPVPPLNLVGDYGGGAMFAVVGILAALHERGAGGRGQVVDVAMADGAAYLGLYQHRMHARGSWRDERGSNSFDGGAPYYDTYACADGRFVAVGALESQFFAALLAGLGLSPELTQDRAGWPELRRHLAEAFATRPRDEWTAHFAGRDACVTPVLTLAEAAADPHAVARAGFVPGADGAAEPAPAPRFGRTPATRRPPQPPAGLEDVRRRWA
jgi:alpha-methylacyl-CoA racemase